MKTKKISRCVLLLMAVSLLAVMLTGYGSKTLDGTYTAAFSKDEITSNTFHNGFVTALGANEVNTITFTSDGNYTYTKELHTEAEDGSVMEPSDATVALLITYTFHGTYTMDGDNAVLNFPTKCEFSENWGPWPPPGTSRTAPAPTHGRTALAPATVCSARRAKAITPWMFL